MTGGSLENVRSRVIQKWNSDVAHELERSKVSVGCFDVRSRLVRVGPFPAFQDRRWWTIWIVVWNLGCWAHRFGLIIVYRMRLKSPQVWFARADVHFEACELRVSGCKRNDFIKSQEIPLVYHGKDRSRCNLWIVVRSSNDPCLRTFLLQRI